MNSKIRTATNTSNFPHTKGRSIGRTSKTELNNNKQQQRQQQRQQQQLYSVLVLEQSYVPKITCKQNDLGISSLKTYFNCNIWQFMLTLALRGSVSESRGSTIFLYMHKLTRHGQNSTIYLSFPNIISGRSLKPFHHTVAFSGLYENDLISVHWVCCGIFSNDNSQHRW